MKRIIIALTLCLSLSQCTTTRHYSGGYHQRPRQSKESLRHDQKVGIVGTIPVVVMMYLFLSTH